MKRKAYLDAGTVGGWQSVTLPAAALEQHVAILGKTGSGKTTAAKSAIVEPLLAAGRRVGVVDPTGAWWGLRTSRDGKKPGWPVLVLGGDHGDMPLVPSSGAAVARLLVEQGVNLVADTSLMTVGERTRWFIEFAGTVYRANRASLHLVLDEAHNFAPQGKVPDPETGKMLHATNSLASGGRSRGIRLVLATQRPQKLHKDTLTSADTLIAMRVLAPHDRSAIEEWIKGAADIGAAKEVLSSLAGLPRGTGWVWYPEGGFLQKIAFPPATTFDSSAAPQDGAAPAPKGAAEIDLTEIKAALAEAVKESEANDPKKLRARIAELEKAAATAAPAVDPAALAAAEERGRQHVIGHLRDAMVRANVADHLRKVEEGLSAVRTAFLPISAIVSEQPWTKEAVKPPFPGAPTFEKAAPKPQPTPAPRAPAGEGGSLSKAERLILTALAQYPQGRTAIQCAMLASYSHTSGGYRNALSSLRSRGLMIGGGDNMRITEAGLAVLGPYEPLPTGEGLRAHWLGKLGKAQRTILQALFDVYPDALDKVTLAERAGYQETSGGYRNALSEMRTLELITRGAPIFASADFFQ